MGNTNSLYIQLQSVEHQAGALMTGTVYLNMSLPGSLTEVSIEVSGRERTTVIERVTEWVDEKPRDPKFPMSKKAVHREYPHSEERTLFNLKLPVWNFNGAFVSGQFSFPFSVALPQRIPGSAELRTKDGSAEISYSVTATVRASLGASNLYSMQPFRVFEVPMNAPRSLKSLETQTVYTCCCFPSGSMEFECLLANDCLNVGDVASIAAAVRNESSKSMKGIKFQLIEHVEISARGYSANERRVVSKSDLAADSVDSFTRNLEMMIPSVDAPVHAVSCRRYYSLEIVAKMSALVSNVTCTIPINIVSGFNVVSVPVVQIPVVTGWTPQVFNTTAAPVFDANVIQPAFIDKTKLFHVQIIG
jgi:hypothetical protein